MKNIAKCCSFIYCRLENRITTKIFDREKLYRYVETVLNAYNPHIDIYPAFAFIKKRIKSNLQRWNHREYTSMIE